MKNKTGFTLIELLVVVLIIGILSAVALPQYTKAVEKARTAELLSNNKTIENALDIAVLEHGGYASEINAIDLAELTGGEWDRSTSVYLTKYFEYSGVCGNDHCITEHYRRTSANALYAFQSYKGKHSDTVYTDWHRKCITEKTEIGRYICKSLENLGWEYLDIEM